MIRHEVGAGSATLAGAYFFVGKRYAWFFRYGSVKYLVARQAFGGVGTLEGNMFIVKTKVGFCIVATGGQLPQVLKVFLIGVCEVLLFLCLAG